MTIWRPAEELTAEIIESAWRLMVWDRVETCTFEEYTSDDGSEELELGADGASCIKWLGLSSSRGWFTHFTVIDAPTEE